MKKVLVILWLLYSFGSFAQTYDVCAGDTVKLNLPTFIGNLQWQQSDDNLTWNDISGATYQPYQIIASIHQYYRAKVINGSCNPVYSDNQELIIIPAPVISVHPSDQSTCIGAGTNFNVAAVGTELYYQWQVSTDGGLTYSDIVAGGLAPVYSNWTTPILTVSNTVTSNNQNRYRCVVTGACQPVAISNDAILTINPIVTGVSATATPNPVCAGSILNLNGSATDANIWNWTGPNGFSSTLQNPTISNITSAAEGVYYLSAGNSNCGFASAVFTSSVLLYGNPVTTAISNNSHFSFSANWDALIGATSYILDVSANSSFSSFVSGFNNLNVGNVTTYTVNGLLANTTYYYRVRANNPCGITANSNTSSGTTVAFYIGENYGGGLIFYIDGTFQHGLIVASTNQSTGAEWGCYSTLITGADGIAIGTGNQNTIDIDAGCTTAGIAADICANLSLNGYTDWYLPSQAELTEMYNTRGTIGGYLSNAYWSSSEATATGAWAKDFNNGNNGSYAKNTAIWRVRAIRSF